MAAHNTLQGSETRRILIITAGQLSRNPRVYKEAVALGNAGFQVTVLRVANVPEYERYDQELTRGAPFQSIVVDHLGSDRRVRLGTLRDRLLTRLGRRAAQWGVESPHAFGAYRSLLQTARRTPAELTIVHTETPLSVGVRLMAEGRRVAADFEDWHSEDLLPMARRGRPYHLLCSIERDLLHQAAYSTTTSEALATALYARYGGNRPSVVYNVFPLQPAPPPLPRRSPPSFFWFSQTIGPGRGLEEFVQVWGRLKTRSRLSLLGAPTPGFLGQLMEALPAAARDRVEIRPTISPDALPAVIAGHDIGLALEQTTPPSRDLTITNKIFQYMNAGVALMTTPTSGQREVLASAPGAGIEIDLSCDDAVRQIDAMVADPIALHRMGGAARRAAEERFSWEKESVRFVEHVRRHV